MNTSSNPNEKDHFGSIFCAKSIENLETLCRETNSKVVISSTWRIKGLKHLKRLFQYRCIDVDILDITPYLFIPRGEEIQEWLDNNDTNKYVILDDNDDFLPEQFPYFIKTNPKIGFDDDCLKRSLEILK